MAGRGADQQGRWSLPDANGIRERMEVGRDAATGAIDSALDAALCTQHSALRLFQLQLTVLVGRGIQLVRSRARETRHGIMKG